MKFFIDTANIDEIKEALTWGVLDGVTTNPSLVAKENQAYDELVSEICKIVPGPVSLEVAGVHTSKEMIQEGERLAKINDNVVVKLPLTTEGLKATKALSDQGIYVNVTLCFSPLQGLLAAKAGATYISPFVGRLDDISHYGMDIVSQLVQIYNNYGFDTEVLVASVRTPTHVLDAALLGADVATVPYKVMKQFVSHPLTDKGIEVFEQDWKRVKHEA
ncbi:MAG: fructose-6-phosphate aldolase [Bdellovibrionales bacterium]|nr:fructose-6-phosphate aldolase [Bdellovibrionales bacterium]